MWYLWMQSREFRKVLSMQWRYIIGGWHIALHPVSTYLFFSFVSFVCLFCYLFVCMYVCLFVCLNVYGSVGLNTIHFTFVSRALWFRTLKKQQLDCSLIWNLHRMCPKHAFTLCKFHEKINGRFERVRANLIGETSKEHGQQKVNCDN